MPAIAYPTRRLDIVIRRGITFFLPVRVRLQDQSIPNLTGWAANASIRVNLDLPATVLVMGAVTGLFGTAPLQYNIDVSVSSAVSSAIADWGGGYWHLELTDTFGNVASIIEGRADLSEV